MNKTLIILSLVLLTSCGPSAEEKRQVEIEQQRIEKEASENSQFDPKIHQLGREGFGFQMKRDVKTNPDELSGKNLPFKSEK